MTLLGSKTAMEEPIDGVNYEIRRCFSGIAKVLERNIVFSKFFGRVGIELGRGLSLIVTRRIVRSGPVSRIARATNKFNAIDSYFRCRPFAAIFVGFEADLRRKFAFLLTNISRGLLLVAPR